MAAQETDAIILYPGPSSGSPFPPLRLSAVDEEELMLLAEYLLHQNLAEYKKFIRKGGDAYFSDPRWKLIREAVDVKAYVEDHEPNKVPFLNKLSDSFNLTNSDGPTSSRKPPNAFPHTCIIGECDGNMSDALYGAVNYREELLQTHAKYLRGVTTNGAILANLRTPTSSAPFDSLTVKWKEVPTPLAVRPIVKSRDFVMLEYSGTTEVESGEVVGFIINHSIHFPQTYVLPRSIRAEMSTCTFYRSLAENRVSSFVLGKMNPKGGLLRQFINVATERGMHACWRSARVGHMRKRAWLVRRKRSRLSISSHEHGISQNCAFCQNEKKGSNRKTWTECCACNRAVCSSCRLKRRMVFMMPCGKVVEQAFSFCRECLIEARNLSAGWVASEEVEAGVGSWMVPRRLTTYRRSSTSGSLSRGSQESTHE